jgi:alkaline phosphatase D
MALLAPELLSPPPALAVPAADVLRSGPMLGYAEIQEVAVWLQTRAAAAVRLRYWEEGRPETARTSEAVETGASGDHVARFVLPGLAFGTRYEYQVVVNGELVELPYPARFATQPMWRWRGDPPALRIALGSCLYVNDPPFDRPGAPYGGGYEILAAIAAQEPQMMLWLGDNVYLREADWTTESGMRARYAHTRALPELQPLLARVHHYATWDDHDYGPDNSDRSFRGREAALRVFRDYWANPAAGTVETPGVFFRFEWGDVELFVLDDRFHRSPGELFPDAEKRMLGRQQLRWLQESLRSSEAPFKLVVSGSQVLNPRIPERPSLAGEHDLEGMRNFPVELEELLAFLRAQRVEGVVFLSGDAHLGELARLQPEGLYPLYELTTSPLTAGVAQVSETTAPNPARVPGTLVVARNFATLEVTGPAGDRTAVLALHDADGAVLWRHPIHQRELTFAEVAASEAASPIEEEELELEAEVPPVVPAVPEEPLPAAPTP